MVVVENVEQSLCIVSSAVELIQSFGEKLEEASPPAPAACF